jgi:hypothetical protein
MDKRLAEAGVTQVDAVVLDIGVSSMQIDQADRGFSFQKEGPLDMRMSQSGESAADFVNTADEAEVAAHRARDCRCAPDRYDYASRGNRPQSTRSSSRCP